MICYTWEIVLVSMLFLIKVAYSARKSSFIKVHSVSGRKVFIFTVYR